MEFDGRANSVQKHMGKYCFKDVLNTNGALDLWRKGKLGQLPGTLIGGLHTLVPMPDYYLVRFPVLKVSEGLEQRNGGYQ